MKNDKFDWLAAAHGMIADIKERRRQRKMEKWAAAGSPACPRAGWTARAVSAVRAAWLGATENGVSLVLRVGRFFASRKRDTATIALIGVFASVAAGCAMATWTMPGTSLFWVENSALAALSTKSQTDKDDSVLISPKGAQWTLASQEALTTDNGVKKVSDCLEAKRCVFAQQRGVGTFAHYLSWLAGVAPAALQALPPQERAAWKNGARLIPVGDIAGLKIAACAFGSVAALCWMGVFFRRPRGSHDRMGAATHMVLLVATASVVASLGLGVVFTGIDMIMHRPGANAKWEPSTAQEAQTLVSLRRVASSRVVKWSLVSEGDWRKDNPKSAQDCFSAGFCGNAENIRAHSALTNIDVDEIQASAYSAEMGFFMEFVFFASSIIAGIWAGGSAALDPFWNGGAVWAQRFRAWTQKGAPSAEKQRLNTAVRAAKRAQKRRPFATDANSQAKVIANGARTRVEPSVPQAARARRL